MARWLVTPRSAWGLCAFLEGAGLIAGPLHRLLVLEASTRTQATQEPK